MITSLIEMLELSNFGHMTASHNLYFKVPLILEGLG